MALIKVLRLNAETIDKQERQLAKEIENTYLFGVEGYNSEEIINVVKDSDAILIISVKVKAEVIKKLEKYKILYNSDYIMLLCLLVPQIEGMIGEKLLKIIKKVQ